MKKIILLSILVFLTLIFKGQDYNMSMLYDNHVLMNPANAGLYYPIGGNLSYRQQWKSIGDPYTTALFSVDGRILSQGTTGSLLGLGLVLVNDISGEAKLNTLNANLAIMGKVMLNESNSLSAGITGGVMQRKLDNDKLRLTDQHDDLGNFEQTINQEGMVTEKRMAPDVGAGIQWSYGRGASTLSSNDPFGCQVGAVFYHVNKPNTGFVEDLDKRNIRMLGHVSISYGIKNTPIQLNPQCIVQIQGPNRMYYPGLRFKYLLQEQSRYTGFLFSRNLTIGGYYRVGDALVLLTQLEWDQFCIGLSYDVNLSDLTKATNSFGAFEISLKFIPVKAASSNKLL